MGRSSAALGGRLQRGGDGAVCELSAAELGGDAAGGGRDRNARNHGLTGDRRAGHRADSAPAPQLPPPAAADTQPTAASRLRKANMLKIWSHGIIYSVLG